MNLQTSREQTSGLDRVVGLSLAAFSMFVVGYTATRAYLTQTEAPNAASTSSDFVVPHEATLWQDLAN